MKIRVSQGSFLVSFALVLFFSPWAHAYQYLKILKNNAVIAYKDPSKQAKILGILSVGDQPEIAAANEEWYKIKIFQKQQYYILGWVFKNSPFIQVMERNELPQSQSKVVSSASSETTTDSTNDTSDQDEDDNNEGTSGKNIKFFGGAVYNLYKYGTSQTKFGLSYEFPIADQLSLGIPASYISGGGFSVYQMGIEALHPITLGSFLISPRIGIAYEYLFGNGESFHAFAAEAGATIDYELWTHFSIGLEPFAANVMFWNTTDSLNEVPFNVRGESMVILRGKW